MASRNAQLNSWVRIDSTNKTMRISDNGADETITLTEGEYWLGFGSHDGNADSVTTGSTSLLEHIESLCPANWFWRLEFPDVDDLTTPTATGHVWLRTPNAANDAILWGNAATTVDKTWFGLPGTYSSTWTTGAAATYEDLSQFSSSLAFVSGVQVREDRDAVEPIESAREAGDGTTYSTYYGRTDGLELQFRLTGLFRDDLDVSYHSMRRWLMQYQARRGIGFYYFPDTSVGSMAAYDVDGAEGARYGFERYCVRAGVPLTWRPLRTTQVYAKEHTQEYLVKKY